MSNCFIDNRGTLIFPIKHDKFNNNFNFKECSISINNKNVFRGIHSNPYEKLVTCIQGKIIDIIINLDSNSDSYLDAQYFILDPSTDLFQIIVPKNYGHAFLSLMENSTIIYHFNGIFTDENTSYINYLDPLLNISMYLSKYIDINTIIISTKDKELKYIEPYEYMVLGSTGFLGKHIIKCLCEKNKRFLKCPYRLENINEIEKYIDMFKPKKIINCAGITGTPNIFWCDENKINTIETNIVYPLVLAKLCKDRNIHYTILGSGGIFKSDNIYNETDEGNFKGNFYSECRINLENIIKNYDNVLYTRINYPVSNTLSDKNLITKLLTYTNIDDNEFSITYIDELFPILIDMIDNNEIGICNLVNEGSIKLSEIMTIINKYKMHEYTLHNNIHTQPRSYSKLSIGKLDKYKISNINTAIHNCVYNYISLNNI